MTAQAQFYDAVQETSSTTGTGTLTLAGAATSFFTFASAGNGQASWGVKYDAYEVDANGNPTGAREIGIGTYTLSGTTLSRDTVLASSNSGALVNFQNALRVALIAPAMDVSQLHPPPNLLANSGHWFFQRLFGAPTTLTTVASDGYGPDRWRMPSQTASLQCKQVDTNGVLETGLRGRYYTQLKQITAAGKIMFCQPLEGVRSYPLNGGVVCFSALLKAGAGTPKYRLGLIQLQAAGTMDTIPANVVTTWSNTAGTDGTLGTNLAYVAPTVVAMGAKGTVNGNAIDCVLSTSWQQFGGVFVLPNDGKNYIPAIWSDAQLAANDIVNVAECYFGPGQAAPYWSEPEDLGREYHRVLRFGFGLPPATGWGGVNTVTGWAGQCASSTGVLFRDMPVKFRTQPILTVSAASDFNVQINLTYVLSSISVATEADQSNIVLVVGFSGAPASQFCGYMQNQNTNATLFLNAEL